MYGQACHCKTGFYFWRFPRYNLASFLGHSNLQTGPGVQQISVRSGLSGVPSSPLFSPILPGAVLDHITWLWHHGGRHIQVKYTVAFLYSWGRRLNVSFMSLYQQYFNIIYIYTYIALALIDLDLWWWNTRTEDLRKTFTSAMEVSDYSTFFSGYFMSLS